MRKRFSRMLKPSFLVAMFFVSRFGFGQASVTTGGGNAGDIPMFTGTSSVAPSGVSIAGQQLNVPGFISASSGAGGVFFSAHQIGPTYYFLHGMFEATTDNTTNLTNYFFRGYVGGVPTYGVRSDGLVTALSFDGFAGPLGLTAGDQLTLIKLANSNPNYNQFYIKQLRNASSGSWETTTTRLQVVTDITPQGYIDFNPPGGQYGIGFGTGGTEFARFLSDGRMGIGTTAPSQKLDVAGNIAISGAGAGLYFPGNATPQTIPWTGTLCGGDYAESIDVTGAADGYEPGDVLVLDPQNPEHFKKADSAYSTLVAGVYSTKPGVVGRHQTTAESDAEVPMAMIGIVPTKVSSVNGKVHVGDLLVTSQIPGLAMKGTDSTRMLGAVIGKAMAEVSEGASIVNVLVTLQ